MSQLTLLLEGPDDIGIVFHLLTRHNLPITERGKLEPDRIALEDGQGSDHILQSLSIRLKVQSGGGGSARLGVILDADTVVTQRWQSITDRLRAFGYSSIPVVPQAEGTVIVERGFPILGIWLMPNNQLAGEIEHFVRLLLPQTDRLWSRAEQVVQQIPAEDRLFADHDMMKAQMHTWLAWQAEPGKPMGQAIRKQFLDSETPAALAFVAWVRRLFTIENI